MTSGLDVIGAVNNIFIGLEFGLGLSIAWNLIGYPFRRWNP